MSSKIQKLKELREKTMVSMSLCVEALDACQGNVDDAIKYVFSHTKCKRPKVDNSKANGKIFQYTGQNQVRAILVLCTETDFAASNNLYIDLGQKLAQLISLKKIEEVELLKNFKYKSDDHNTALEHLSALLGEHVYIKDFGYVEGNNSGCYIHQESKACSVVLEKGSSEEAMEIAVQLISDPDIKYMSLDDIDMNHFQEVMKDTFEEHKDKKQLVLEKIMQGAKQKFYQTYVLPYTPYYKDRSKAVSDVLDRETIVKSFKKYTVR